MDPLSAISGVAQIAQVTTQTIHGLAILRSKYKNADLTIRSLIGELSTIKSAVIQLDDWARYNQHNYGNGAVGAVNEYDEGLSVAIEGCRAIMDVLAEEVNALAHNTADGTVVGFTARAKVVWNEGIMRDHQDRLHAQVMALQLMLQACQCRTATEQVELLRKVESRQIIKKVADDTATLRSISRMDNLSISRGQPSVGSTEFEFDGTVLESNVYQRAGNMRPRPSKAGHHSITGISNQEVTGVDHDSGFEMDAVPFSPDPPNPLALDTGFSVGEKPMRSNAKSLSRGDSTYSSLGSRSIGSKREKLRSMIRRFSSASSFSPVTSPGPDSPDGRRSRCRDFNVSIDLKTEDGKSAPLIVKLAQSGSRQDVERLIQNNHDIEKRHLKTRRNALLVAAHCGKQEIVELLVQNNARIDVRDATGCTALHLAASRGHVEVLGLLILEGMDIEVRDAQEKTALWMAADKGQLDSVRILVESGARVNSRGHNQMTSFHVAAKSGDVEIVEYLMYNGSADIEAKDASMMTAFHHACESGHKEVVDLLLNNKVDANAPGNDGRSPLICAAALGRLHLVQLLLSKKASVRSTDDNGMTALHWAAFNGHTEIVHLLSQKKDTLSAKNVTGRTPLHVAVMAGQFGVIELLLRKENVALEARCAGGLTMLHYACLHDRPEIAHLLLASGCDIEAETSKDQQRPVHVAAASGSVKLIKLLCEKGASLEARNSMGDRALCVACRLGRASAVQVLLIEGSQPYRQFGNQLHKDSPLCLAAMGGHVSVAALLLQHGACVDQADENGWQPARYAAYYGHPRVLELLLSNSSLSYRELSVDKIGFAPLATISESQKAEIRELLSRSRQQHRNSTTSAGVRTAPRPSPLPQIVSPFVPTSYRPATPDDDNTGPHELPGTLEQGLPASRSHTPEQMRGTETRATHLVGSDDLQHALPPIIGSRSTVQTPLPQPVPISASSPWIDRINTQVEALPCTPPVVPASPGVPLTSSQLALHNQATGSSYHPPTEQQSDISSVASVYTAPEADARPDPALSHS